MTVDTDLTRGALMRRGALIAAGAFGVSAATPATEPALAVAGAYAVSFAGYGAVGDGTTDDSAAFQAAHDAVAGEGGIVHIPRGTYLLGTPVMLAPHNDG